MKSIAYVLIGIGVVGVILGCMMFGDIGLAALIGAATALVSGFGFLKIAQKG